MKCVAQRRCQKVLTAGPLKGKTQFFSRGDIGEFEECPKGFYPLPGEEGEGTPKVKLDFGKMSEAELVEASFEIDELKEYMGENHPTVKINGRIGIPRLIEKLLYARDNDTTVAEAPKKSHELDNL